MQSLPVLPSVTKLSNVVTRVLGQNPGRYTLQGTNTYLVSVSPLKSPWPSMPNPRSADSSLPLQHPSTSSVILLDTAHGIPAYIPLLRPLITPSANVTIVLSHWHEDHVDGLPDVLRLLHELGCPKPKVWKLAAEEGNRDAEVEAGLEGKEEAEWLEKPSAGEELSKGGLISRLRKGQVLKLPAEDGNESEAEGMPELEVVHTPGHTSDSISLLLRTSSTSKTSAGSTPPVLFTFDTGERASITWGIPGLTSLLLQCSGTVQQCSRTLGSTWPHSHR